jgi:hypothetical protein
VGRLSPFEFCSLKNIPVIFGVTTRERFALAAFVKLFGGVGTRCVE